ncbi:MAG: hypothetical protein WAZ98_13875 [Cyclobacteriaceae bacterium]
MKFLIGMSQVNVQEKNKIGKGFVDDHKAELRSANVLNAFAQNNDKYVTFVGRMTGKSPWWFTH